MAAGFKVLKSHDFLPQQFFVIYVAQVPGLWNSISRSKADSRPIENCILKIWHPAVRRHRNIHHNTATVRNRPAIHTHAVLRSRADSPSPRVQANANVPDRTDAGGGCVTALTPSNEAKLRIAQRKER